MGARWWPDLGVEPYYADESVVVLNADCREVLPRLAPGSVDAVVSDPPYGMNRVLSGHKVIARLGGVVGDDEPFDPALCLSVGRYHILWGANHYASRLPDETCWLVWEKHDHSLWGHRSTSPFEMAWTNLGGACKAYRHIWDGSIKQGEGSGREHLHPTEKPVELMRWCLGLIPRAQTILDPFAGSGTTGVAAKSMGRRALLVEIEERYCEVAARRVEQAAQLAMAV